LLVIEILGNNSKSITFWLDLIYNIDILKMVGVRNAWATLLHGESLLHGDNFAQFKL